MVPASDEIWKLIKETQKNLKEVSASQKETDRQIKTLSAETDRQIKTLSGEADRQIKEYNRRLEKTRKIFETQWGRLVESLVEGKLLELLKSRGIEVRQTGPRVEVSYTGEDGDIKKREFDIIAVNGEEVVAVEVKTTLTPDKVKYFLESLKDFRKYFPDYKSKTVYGAVAYLKSDSEAPLFSERQGLFVIRATGDSASIINKKGFKPKAFA